jgi:P4 family phage/plasmid primase-like protien
MHIPVITVKKTDLKNFKKSIKDPVAVSHIDNILKGEETTEENAKAACIAFLAKFPDTDIHSLCEAMGWESLFESIQSMRQAEIERDILSPETTKPGSKAPSLEIPEGDIEPEPLADITLADRFKQQYSFRNRSATTRFGCTDAKLSSMAFVLFGEDSCVRIQETRTWLRWVGHKWEECDEGHIRQNLDEVALLLEQDMKATKKRYSQAHSGGDFEILAILKGRYSMPEDVNLDSVRELFLAEMERVQTMVSRLESLVGRNAIIEMMGDRLVKSIKCLDTNTDEIVFTNTAWNAATGVFYPPRRSSLATRSTERAWRTPSVESRENWKHYLEGLGFDTDTMTYLQRCFGYTLLGRGTAKKYWWFRGETHTSKTTTVQLVAKCVGSYVETTQAKMWLAKGNNANGHTDELARLRGCRMVTADEFPKVSRLDDALVKQVTSGGAPMSASRKGEKGFTFDIYFAMFFSSNYDPFIAEDDAALIARLTALTFKTKVEKIDPEFVKKYLSAGDNALAVLAWCMEGASDFIREGFGEEPLEIKTSREEYQKEQSSIGEQLHEVIAINPGKKAFANDIKIALVAYQKATRQNVIFSDRQLSKAIETLFSVTPQRGTNGRRVYHGLEIIDTRPKPKGFAREIDYGWEQEEDQPN